MNIGSGLVITATTKKLSTGFLPTTLTAGVLPQPLTPSRGSEEGSLSCENSHCVNRTQSSSPTGKERRVTH